MKKTIFVFISTWFLLVGNVFGQQDPLTSQYMFTPMVINPSYAGFHDMVSATMSARSQWMGIGDGAPTTGIFNVHSSLPIDKMGAGLTISNDQFGVQNNIEVSLAGSYQIRMEHTTFSLGLQGGFVNYSVDYSSINTGDSTSTIIDPTDPAFNGFQADNIFQPNFGFGAMYLTKHYFVGLSVPRLLENNNVTGHSMYLRHYYGFAGYILDLRYIKIKPSVLLKALAPKNNGEDAEDDSNIPTYYSVDFNLSALIFNKIWVGLSARNLSDLALMGQLQLSRYLKVGYAFEVPYNEAIRKAGGKGYVNQIPTHEVMVNVNFKLLDVQAVQGFLF